MDVCEGQKGKERKLLPFKAKSIIVDFFFFFLASVILIIARNLAQRKHLLSPYFL